MIIPNHFNLCKIEPDGYSLKIFEGMSQGYCKRKRFGIINYHYTTPNEGLLYDKHIPQAFNNQEMSMYGGASEHNVE